MKCNGIHVLAANSVFVYVKLMAVHSILYFEVLWFENMIMRILFDKGLYVIKYQI